MSKKDTKTKILNSAETLFSKQGISNTSLRNIIAKANVNIAAIHYHFGSRDEVIKAVFARRINPLNKIRLERLKEIEEKSKGQSLKAEDIIKSFVSPFLNCPDFANKKMAGLFKHLYTEPDQVKNAVTICEEVFDRYVRALSFALPDLTLQEIVIRFNFMIAVLSVAIADGVPVNKKLNETDEMLDQEFMIKNAIRFISGGFKIPLCRELKE